MGAMTTKKRDDALWDLGALAVEMQQGYRMMSTLVDKARANGATWREIGDRLGINDSAACQQYGPKGTRRQEKVAFTAPTSTRATATTIRRPSAKRAVAREQQQLAV